MSRGTKKTNIASIIGTVVLLVGILAGVFLVQQSQEFRERAGLDVEQMIVVCHKIPTEVGFWEEIEVPESQLEMYIDQGDLLGNCPADFNVKKNVSSEETEAQVEVNDEKEETGVKLVDTTSTEPREEELRVIESTPIPTKEVTKTDSSLRFFIKLQGVTASRPGRLVNVTFAHDTESHTYKDVSITPNSEGVYFGQLENIPSGTFDISFKTDSHLRKTHTNIKLEPGINTWYFENNPLVAGDFNSDNVLDISDIALFMAEMNSESVNVDQKNKQFDVDVNAKIDVNDLKLVLSNLDSVVLEGE